MDYPCAKFGDFSLSSFDFIVHTHTDRQNHGYRITDDRYTHATTVGVRNYSFLPWSSALA